MWFYLLLFSLSVFPLTLVATLIFLIKRDQVWKKWLLACIISLALLVVSLMAFPLPE